MGQTEKSARATSFLPRTVMGTVLCHSGSYKSVFVFETFRFHLNELKQREGGGGRAGVDSAPNPTNPAVPSLLLLQADSGQCQLYILNIYLSLRPLKIS